MDGGACETDFPVIGGWRRPGLIAGRIGCGRGRPARRFLLSEARHDRDLQGAGANVGGRGTQPAHRLHHRFTLKQSERPHPAMLAMLANGDDPEKLVIVGLRDGRMNSIYRARAVLAMLTATARATPVFQEYQVEEVFTFLDVCKMLGFEKVTISDGRDLAHQMLID